MRRTTRSRNRGEALRRWVRDRGASIGLAAVVLAVAGSTVLPSGSDDTSPDRAREQAAPEASGTPDVTGTGGAVAEGGEGRSRSSVSIEGGAASGRSSKRVAAPSSRGSSSGDASRTSPTRSSVPAATSTTVGARGADTETRWECTGSPQGWSCSGEIDGTDAAWSCGSSGEGRSCSGDLGAGATAWTCAHASSERSASCTGAVGGDAAEWRCSWKDELRCVADDGGVATGMWALGTSIHGSMGQVLVEEVEGPMIGPRGARLAAAALPAASA